MICVHLHSHLLLVFLIIAHVAIISLCVATCQNHNRQSEILSLQCGCTIAKGFLKNRQRHSKTILASYNMCVVIYCQYRNTIEYYRILDIYRDCIPPKSTSRMEFHLPNSDGLFTFTLQIFCLFPGWDIARSVYGLAKIYNI